MSNTLREVFNRATGSLSTPFQSAHIGDVLRQDVKQELKGADPAADAAQLATLESVSLPSVGRASQILRAFSRAGGVTGELTVKKYGATPATGEIAVAPNGDIVVLAADAITNLDVVYMCESGEVVTVDLPVVSNVMTLPSGLVARGIKCIVDASVTAGTTTGHKIIVAHGATPGAGQCALSLTGATVVFHATMAATRATMTLLVGRQVTLTANLDAESTLL